MSNFDGLFLIEFLSNRLQTLAQAVLPDLSSIYWITVCINVGSLLYMPGDVPLMQ